MKLLLFDIDGTLLTSQGLGRHAVETSLSRLVGQPITTEGVSFSGKTDPQILREVLERNGLEGTRLTEMLPRAREVFAETARTHFDPARIFVYEGVHALLACLRERTDVQLGLLTGNLEEMAYRKVEAVGLADCFPFGAFGSDHEDRYRLPPIALERARLYTGRSFAGKEVVIIGDTQHDILCGRALGVCSVAVATGHFSREDLAVHKPDVLFDSLANVDQFVTDVIERTLL